MTRAHRRRHVVMWSILAPLIVVVILLALRARQDRAAALTSATLTPTALTPAPLSETEP